MPCESTYDQAVLPQKHTKTTYEWYDANARTYKGKHGVEGLQLLGNANLVNVAHSKYQKFA